MPPYIPGQIREQIKQRLKGATAALSYMVQNAWTKNYSEDPQLARKLVPSSTFQLNRLLCFLIDKPEKIGI